MTLRIYTDLEQGEPAWLAARCGVLTASQIGKLLTPQLGIANNDTSRGLTLTLAAERITQHVEYVYPTFAMQRGSEEEPIARAVYAKHYGEVSEVGFMTRDIGGVTIGYSPDGLIQTHGLLEIKSRNPKEHLKTILAGKPPVENLAQLYTGLLVSQRDWIDYCSFSAGLPLYTIRVYPDQAWFDALTAAALAFEENVADVISSYNTITRELPPTERRIEIEDITF